MSNFKNIVIAIASVVVFSNITNAQVVKAGYSVTVEDPLKVKYLGDDGDYLLFQVTLQSNTPANTLFVIDDRNEGEIYSSVLSNNFKVQTVKIEKIESKQVLNFKLVLGRKTYSKSFSVNTRLIPNTTVTETDITKL